MDTLAKAKLLLEYYQFTRGSGHTHTLLEGVKNCDRVYVLAHTMTYADQLVKLSRNRKAIPMSLSSGFDQNKLLGGTAPLAIDNSAIIFLLSELVSELETLRAKISGKGWQIDD